jgi:hypothetical protein
MQELAQQWPYFLKAQILIHQNLVAHYFETDDVFKEKKYESIMNESIPF